MWWALAGAIALEVIATMSLRASEGLRKKIWLLPLVVGYLASFWLLSLSLSLGMPVGIAYGIWSACGVALVAVIAKFVFGEPLTLLMGAGIGAVFPSFQSGAVHGVASAKFGIAAATTQTNSRIAGTFGVAVAVVLVGGATTGDAAAFDRLWLFLAALAVVSAIASWRVDTRAVATAEPAPLIP